MRSRPLSFALAAAVLLLPGLNAGKAQNKRTVWDGVYTAAQAQRGMATFKSQCAMCHGENMAGGGGAPAAAGPEFAFNWKGKTAGELLTYLKGNMPPNDAGSLSDQKYTDIIAAIFQTTEFPAGNTELPSDPDALSAIQITPDKP
jgi:mono/diheme cytochrome c family protein